MFFNLKESYLRLILLTNQICLVSNLAGLHLIVSVEHFFHKYFKLTLMRDSQLVEL